MFSLRQWFAGLAAGAGLLLFAGLMAFFYWLPSDEQLAQTVSDQLGAALGVSVHVGSLNWHVLPAPYVVLEDLSTSQADPLTIKKIALHLNVGALLQRRIRLDSAEIEGGNVPQKSLAGLGSGGMGNDDADWSGPGGLVLDAVPLSRLQFKNLTWVSRTGYAVVYEGDVDFDANWRPRLAHLRRPGIRPVTDLQLTRQGQQDRWDVLAHLGGGTAKGEAQLRPLAGKGLLQLDGKLQLQDVEVAATSQAFNRRAVLAGKAAGETVLRAQGRHIGELARSLHTQTVFSMGASTLLRFDLARAVRSLGRDHNGQTALDSVTGQLDTQNTADGVIITFSQLKARSGLLSASGDARLLNRHIEAEFAVDLVSGVVGVPLKLSGPLDKVRVSVPAGAVAGAAVGTVVLPGVGTAIGARLGAALGSIFGNTPSAQPSEKPQNTPAEIR